jgi:hypothetical protein
MRLFASQCQIEDCGFTRLQSHSPKSLLPGDTSFHVMEVGEERERDEVEQHTDLFRIAGETSCTYSRSFVGRTEQCGAENVDVNGCATGEPTTRIPAAILA